jgi:hypothetical protein
VAAEFERAVLLGQSLAQAAVAGYFVCPEVPVRRRMGKLEALLRPYTTYDSDKVTAARWEVPAAVQLPEAAGGLE